MDELKEQRRHFQKKNKEIMCCVIALLFAGIIFGLAIAGVVKKDVKFSEEENRVLAQLPTSNVEDLKNKRFMEDLEAYTSDQFVMRDLWIRLKVYSDLCIGKRELNGVYLGKDKYLIQEPLNPDPAYVQKTTGAMVQFASDHQDMNINAMIIPDAAYVMDQYLPKGAVIRDQGADMEMLREQLAFQMGFIDVGNTLKEHTDEEIYYRTDHHWTTRGAYYAFKAAAEQLGISETLKTYRPYTVSTDFSGTLASTSGYHGAEDSIQVYAPENEDVDYLVSDSDNKEKRATVYDQSALDRKNQYEVFFGGNHASVEIEIANETDRKLLVFKDSYANCFVPFLLPYYDKIILIDPRYYYEQVENLITKEGITDVLFLYNLNTFMSDNSLADILSGV